MKSVLDHTEIRFTPKVCLNSKEQKASQLSKVWGGSIKFGAGKKYNFDTCTFASTYANTIMRLFLHAEERDKSDFRMISDVDATITEAKLEQFYRRSLYNSDKSIAESRNALAAQQEIRRLRDERDNPEAIDFNHEGLFFRKAHIGHVTKVIGNQAEIVFETSTGKSITQVYDMTQFIDGKRLKEGDTVEACAVLREAIELPSDEDELRPIPDFLEGKKNC